MSCSRALVLYTSAGQYRCLKNSIHQMTKFHFWTLFLDEALQSGVGPLATRPGLLLLLVRRPACLMFSLKYVYYPTGYRRSAAAGSQKK